MTVRASVAGDEADEGVAGSSIVFSSCGSLGASPGLGDALMLRILDRRRV
jgi:hypothetical protein